MVMAMMLAHDHKLLEDVSNGDASALEALLAVVNDYALRRIIPGQLINAPFEPRTQEGESPSSLEQQEGTTTGADQG